MGTVNSGAIVMGYRPTKASPSPSTTSVLWIDHASSMGAAAAATHSADRLEQDVNSAPTSQLKSSTSSLTVENDLLEHDLEEQKKATTSQITGNIT